MEEVGSYRVKYLVRNHLIIHCNCAQSHAGGQRERSRSINGDMAGASGHGYCLCHSCLHHAGLLNMGI
jgi:hypothetical protein